MSKQSPSERQAERDRCEARDRCTNCGRSKSPVNRCDDDIDEDGQCPHLTIVRLRAQVTERDKRIAELEEQLREARSRPREMNDAEAIRAMDRRGR